MVGVPVATDRQLQSSKPFLLIADEVHNDYYRATTFDTWMQRSEDI